MSVTLEFRYTSADMGKAQKAALKHLRRHRVDLRIKQVVTWFIFVAIALAIIHNVPRKNATPAATATTQPAGIPASTSALMQTVLSLLPWAIIVPVVALMTWWRIRKARQVPASLTEMHAMSVSEDGLIWRYPAFQTEYRWHAFHGFADTANLFVLFQSDARKEKFMRMLIVPKRAFVTREMFEEFQRLLNVHVRPHDAAFPVLPVSPKP